MPHVLFHILLPLLSLYLGDSAMVLNTAVILYLNSYTLFLSMITLRFIYIRRQTFELIPVWSYSARQFLSKNPGTIIHEVLQDLYLHVGIIGGIHIYEFHTYPLYILHKRILYYIQNLINNGKLFFQMGQLHFHKQCRSILLHLHSDHHLVLLIFKNILVHQLSIQQQLIVVLICVPLEVDIFYMFIGHLGYYPLLRRTY